MMRLYKIATDLVKAMKEDKLNSKIWKEVQETPFKTRKELVEKVEREFSCVEMQYPENYQETLAKKLAEKASKLSDKENQGDEKSKGKKRKNSEEIEPLSCINKAPLGGKVLFEKISFPFILFCHNDETQM